MKNFILTGIKKGWINHEFTFISFESILSICLNTVYKTIFNRFGVGFYIPYNNPLSAKSEFDTALVVLIKEIIG